MFLMTNTGILLETKEIVFHLIVRNDRLFRRFFWRMEPKLGLDQMFGSKDSLDLNSMLSRRDEFAIIISWFLSTSFELDDEPFEPRNTFPTEFSILD